MARYAAIDIGSNAMRMLFEQVYETAEGPVFKKLSLVRLPVRLGADAFKDGSISKEKEEHLLSMAHAFTHLCSIFEVEEYKATATSAMRNAKNGAQIIQKIHDETGVKIDIIAGEMEAKILYESIFNTGKLRKDESYMFIDVGGGSTEINFYVNGERKDWKSFKLGTVRLKERIQSEETWEKFSHWIRAKVNEYQPKFAVGTGGNINKIYKLCRHRDWEMLTAQEILEKIEFLKSLSPEEMVRSFDIKEDRADVIVPGGLIYHRAMIEAGINEMIVPKVGLADGLIREMYFSAKQKNEKATV